MLFVPFPVSINMVAVAFETFSDTDQIYAKHADNNVTTEVTCAPHSLLTDLLLLPLTAGMKLKLTAS